MMRADGQDAQDVLRAEDDLDKRKQVAIDGGEEGVTAAAQQPAAGHHQLLGARHVLQHLQAGRRYRRPPDCFAAMNSALM